MCPAIDKIQHWILTVYPYPQYSAEAFPLIVRDVGMSSATAILWFFNFIVGITFPRLLGAFKPQGAFGWYAACEYLSVSMLPRTCKRSDVPLDCHSGNAIGFVLVLFLVPETKSLSLEELDQGTFFHPSFSLIGTLRVDFNHSHR